MKKTLGEKRRNPKGEGKIREEGRKPEHAVCPESKRQEACQGAKV